MALLAQTASVAWFVLSSTGIEERQPARIAVPLALEVEVGADSWETSLIPPKQGIAEGEADMVCLDLLLVVDPC